MDSKRRSELARALRAWIRDPDGFPIESFFGSAREVRTLDGYEQRNILLSRYASSTNQTSLKKCAESLQERFSFCRSGIKHPIDYGQRFAELYWAMEVLRLELPEARTIRRVLSDG